VAVWDCFTFFNELDVLEVRLTELDERVDHFVLAESPLTHRGHPKPLYFEENRSRFARWDHKIIHLVVDLPETCPDPWERERRQRDAMAEVLVAEADPADLVILTDVDEVPRESAVPKILEMTLTGPVALGMRLYYYELHWRDPGIWLHPKAIRVRDLDRLVFRRGGTLSDLRLVFELPVVSEAGWHFSSFMAPHAIAEKMRAFAHAELDTSGTNDPAKLLQARMAGVSPAGSVLDRVNDPFPPHVLRLLGQFEGSATEDHAKASGPPGR
jgi:beta-1,4-mannosyl-glycoprotein beta-1,4-N-acetylglucosaminyltransferase